MIYTKKNHIIGNNLSQYVWDASVMNHFQKRAELRLIFLDAHFLID